MQKFKIGDEVICIKESKHLNIVKGEIYTIVAIDKSDLTDIRVRVKGSHISLCYYRFILNTRASKLLYSPTTKET